MTRPARSFAHALLCAALLCGAQRAAAAPPAEPQAAADALSENVEEALLELRVRLALLEHLGPDAALVRIRIDGRRVILGGEVRERSTHESAATVAKAVEGVGKVEDDGLRLTRPAPVGRAQRAVAEAEREIGDALLESRVKKRLIEELGKHAFELEVEASEGVVTLSGTLPDRERHRLAQRAAQGTPGVKKLIDLVKVGG
jgi:osmotically-inducible protein OsmY